MEPIKHFKPLGRKPEKPTVFILSEHDWSYMAIERVFTTYKAAKEFAKENPASSGSYYILREFEVY